MRAFGSVKNAHLYIPIRPSVRPPIASSVPRRVYKLPDFPLFPPSPCLSCFPIFFPSLLAPSTMIVDRGGSNALYRPGPSGNLTRTSWIADIYEP